MLEIVMPTSFDAELLDRVAVLNELHAQSDSRVTDFYGSPPRSHTGCGRPERSLPRVNSAALARHVNDAREHGFGFTFLVNSSCTANREFTASGRAGLLDDLRWARDIGCTALVVASPYLIELARRHVPELRLHVSSIAFAKSTKEAAHYLRRGASRLILDPDTVRDFPFIRRLRREQPELELEALCNHPCLLHCPYETYCYNTDSHSSSVPSQTDPANLPESRSPVVPRDNAHAPYEAFALLRCHLDKLEHPVEFLKGSWFRPEASSLYEEVGVKAIKIAGRGRSTAWLARTAEAYLTRRWQGDPLDLVWEAQWTAVWRAAGIDRPPPRPVRLRSRELDGFWKHFARTPVACGSGCGACRHCESFAERAVDVDPEALRAALKAFESRLAALLEDPRGPEPGLS